VPGDGLARARALTDAGGQGAGGDLHSRMARRTWRGRWRGDEAVKVRPPEPIETVQLSGIKMSYALRRAGRR